MAVRKVVFCQRLGGPHPLQRPGSKRGTRPPEVQRLIHAGESRPHVVHQQDDRTTLVFRALRPQPFSRNGVQPVRGPPWSFSAAGTLVASDSQHWHLLTIPYYHHCMSLAVLSPIIACHKKIFIYTPTLKALHLSFIHQQLHQLFSKLIIHP